jgi:serine protease Do
MTDETTPMPPPLPAQPPQQSSAGGGASIFTGGALIPDAEVRRASALAVQPLRSPRWVLPWLLLVLLLVWLLPPTVERVQYALTRGRERAEVESAREQLASPALRDVSKAFELVAKSIGPSVVHIDTRQTLQNSHGDDVAAFFGLPEHYEMQGQASGVIVDPEGYIVTNHHVVQGAQEIRVVLSDNESYSAYVVGSDPATDLAVLKIGAKGLIAAEWGNSDTLHPGSMVWAIGNPYTKLDKSITFGIVSATSRRGLSESPFLDFLQTDAAVNPGNSGGPLVDIQGKVVGINTAIVGRAYQGISFAIPSAMARDVYERLRSSGKVVRCWLGVKPGELTARAAEDLDLKDKRGAVVQQVVAGSPAARAGIREDDVILTWNGQPVESPAALTLLVANT